MFNFIANLFALPSDKDYVVLARRYLVPPTSQPVFQEFRIKAASPYAAARKFDTTLTAWTRLDVTELS